MNMLTIEGKRYPAAYKRDDIRYWRKLRHVQCDSCGDDIAGREGDICVRCATIRQGKSVPMFMTDYDIRYDYTHARNQMEQILVLSELNLVSMDYMANYLRKIGCTVPEVIFRTGNDHKTRAILPDQECWRLYYMGCTDAQIADQLQINVNSFIKWRKRHDLKANKKVAK